METSKNRASALSDKVKGLGNITGIPVLCDLVSNTAFSYEDGEGSTSVPYKSNSKYHMAGKVVIRVAMKSWSRT